MMKHYVRLACFVGGALFGSAGVKLLTSKDAKNAYIHITAAGPADEGQRVEQRSPPSKRTPPTLWPPPKTSMRPGPPKEAETQVEGQEA